jgi:hypothetical protein
MIGAVALQMQCVASVASAGLTSPSSLMMQNLAHARSADAENGLTWNMTRTRAVAMKTMRPLDELRQGKRLAMKMMTTASMQALAVKPLRPMQKLLQASVQRNMILNRIRRSAPH